MPQVPWKMSWWSTMCEALTVMKKIAMIGIGTHVSAAVVVISLGWGNPFANRVDPVGLQGFTVSVAALGSCIGTVITCPLLPLLSHKASANPNGSPPPHRITVIVSNAWVVMRQSMTTLTLALLLPGCATMLLLWGGVPVARYNAHSLFISIAVNMSSVAMAIKYRRFIRLQASATTTTRLSLVYPQQAIGTQVESPRRNEKTYSWRRAAYRALRISVPSVASAIIAIQYITISRRVHFDSVQAFAIFAVASSLLKTLLPCVVKFYISKNSIRESRNVFFMVAAPLFHIEIQLRMAMLKAQATTPLIVSSGFVNVVELVARAVAVAFDLALVRRAERRLARKKARLMARQRDGDKDDTHSRILLLEENHNTWKTAHFRLCAAETIAGMAAEYCGIGLMTIFMLVLHGNASIDLPRQPHSSTIGLLRYHAAAWATQMGFEVVTDVLATVAEIRLGIPVLEVITSDTDGFVGWAVAIIAAHASGLCLSSFIVA